MDGLDRVLVEFGVDGQVIGHPSMFSVYFGEGRPTEYRDIAGHDARLYSAVVAGMIHRGVMP